MRPMIRLAWVLIPMLLAGGCAHPRSGAGGVAADGAAIYHVDTHLESRSISPENRSGGRGIGGQAASPLGVGRKGSPTITIAPGEEMDLCDIEGPGTIRHIWMTGVIHRNNDRLRALVIRAWWDDQPHPSIEAPLGDFMGLAHGFTNPYQSAAHSVGRNTALNFWLPMPFTRRARITLRNDSEADARIFYQIDYTIGDRHPVDVGRMHTLFRRENPTTPTVDFEILPRRVGRGRFIGCVLGIRDLDTSRWWGEGEVKFYIDGDEQFPTIAGTGAEDYVGLSYGMQDTPYLLHGCSLNENGYISMYRWHLPDPIYWKKDCRVTIQQIGYRRPDYFERADDWSTATFWYEPIPSAPLPPLPSLEERMADLYKRPLPE